MRARLMPEMGYKRGRLAAGSLVAALALSAATACSPATNGGRAPAIAVCPGGSRQMEDDVLNNTPGDVKRLLALTHKLGPTSQTVIAQYNKQVTAELAANVKDLQKTAPGTVIIGVAARLAPEVGGFAMTQADADALASLTANDMTALRVAGDFKVDSGITYVGNGGVIQPNALASLIFEGDYGCTYVAAGAH